MTGFWIGLILFYGVFALSKGQNTSYRIKKITPLLITKIAQEAYFENKGLEFNNKPVNSSKAAPFDDFDEATIDADYIDELKELTLSVINSTSQTASNIKKGSWLAEKVTKQLVKRLLLSREEIINDLPKIKISGTLLSDICEEEEDLIKFDDLEDVKTVPQEIPNCAFSKYRTMDGFCNNFLNANWGIAMKSYERFLDNSYADGVSSPRNGKDGVLPSARQLTVLLHKDIDNPNQLMSHMFMQFGQFIAHDISSALGTVDVDGTIPVCCGKKPVTRHEECFPVDIEDNDPFYSHFGLKCMEFLRSAPAPRPKCVLGPRNQINAITSFLDASSVYGESLDKGAELRTFTEGKLRSIPFKGSLKPLLLNKAESVDKCNVPITTGQCEFKAGDARLNLHVALIIMHTIWLREHNRIADGLQKVNPEWDTETLYQEARRIVGAEMQHIVYNEFLAPLLGDVLYDHDLLLLDEGYYKGYDIFVNPTMRVGFATAAFRFGHTLIQGSFDLRDNKYVKINEKPNNLSDHFLNTKDVYKPGNVDNYVRGLLRENMQNYDEFITAQVSDFLFKRPNGKFGIDLVATNIQRGRDHGVPPYMKWRQWCRLKTAQTFEELESIIKPAKVQILKKLYKHVEDIDLYSGGLSESPIIHGIVGPTFACIIAKQFELLRKGDRYWYENEHPSQSNGLLQGFTKDQLMEIRNVSLSKILCDNSDEISEIQQDAFFIPDIKTNPVVNCSDLPTIDFKKWKNENTSEFSSHPSDLTLMKAVMSLMPKLRRNSKIIFPN